ncbi:MAG TPA: mechanosensitive ion channel domain-containing protein [Candidatus Sulfotelmatobacter sp.]|nr:mechanosensitive ion channel domain-containing protein [Candidatus Sulfotelmatobacter sp.]
MAPAESWAWVQSTILLVVAALVGVLAHAALVWAMRRIARRTRSAMADALVRRARGPTWAILPLLTVVPTLPFLSVPPHVEGLIHRALGLGLIAAFAWLAVAFTELLDDLITARYSAEGLNTQRARRIRTQVRVLRRIASVLIIVIALAGMLMTFPSIRNVGTSLFASAGLAGLVVGFAARPALSNLIAGVQIALTEPMRLEDFVVVEGETGSIEEIGSTYVVVRTWDRRRLVVPLTSFIERPFQNWTRHTTDLLGTVLLYADYSVPVEEVRQELRRILTASDLWDGDAWALEVTNLTDRCMELRALMSAQEAGKLWELRCLVREHLVAFLQARFPESLPRLRAEIQTPSPAPSDPEPGPPARRA